MKRFLIATSALAIAALLLWKVLQRSPNPPPTDVARSSGNATGTTSGLAPGKTSNSGGLTPLPAEPRSKIADALNAPTGTPADDVRIVGNVLAAFRTNFPRDGNPVGTNAEITAALTGKNPLRLAVLPADHPAINRDGELCDRWGTPFIFHAWSGKEMEIRSAGPDKKPYNADDVLLSPPSSTVKL